MSGVFAPRRYDAATLGLLPEAWADAIAAVAREHAFPTILDGTASTSTDERHDPIRIYVATGNVIGEHLPWLVALYAGPFRAFATETLGRQTYVSRHADSAVNINVLRGTGSRYERHVDSNAVTGVLFVTTHDEASGGTLIFYTDDGVRRYPSVSGQCLFFDARATPHEVTPLASNTERVTVVMNYYDTEDYERPADLDAYLYTEATT